MDDLQEKVTTLWVENEDCTVNWLRGEITFECLVNGYSIHISVVYEPNDLVAEKLLVVLRIEVGLSRLRAVQLEALANTFSQDIDCRICFHNLVHSLL